MTTVALERRGIAVPAERRTERRFGVALRDLVLAREDERFLTPSGNVNYMAFVKEEMEPRGIKYETLRKAIASERLPSATLIEKCAEALGVEPDYFVEYRLAQAHRAFDVTEVGWAEAIANLRRFAQGEDDD